jgi:hypothetical protein
MKVGKTTIMNARKRFPELVPSLEEQSVEKFEVTVARELFTTDPFFSRNVIIDLLGDQYEKMPVSKTRLNSEIFKTWQKKLDAGTAPEWLEAIAPDGKLTEFGLGAPASDFPEPRA